MLSSRNLISHWYWHKRTFSRTKNSFPLKMIQNNIAFWVPYYIQVLLYIENLDCIYSSGEILEWPNIGARVCIFIPEILKHTVTSPDKRCFMFAKCFWSVRHLFVGAYLSRSWTFNVFLQTRVSSRASAAYLPQAQEDSQQPLPRVSDMRPFFVALKSKGYLPTW